MQHGGGGLEGISFSNGFLRDCLVNFHTVVRWNLFPDTSGTTSRVFTALLRLGTAAVILWGRRPARAFALMNALSSLNTRYDGQVLLDGADVRAMGRQAVGVRGIRLRDEDYVITCTVNGDDIPMKMLIYHLRKLISMKTSLFMGWQHQWLRWHALMRRRL